MGCKTVVSATFAPCLGLNQKNSISFIIFSGFPLPFADTFADSQQIKKRGKKSKSYLFGLDDVLIEINLCAFQAFRLIVSKQNNQHFFRSVALRLRIERPYIPKPFTNYQSAVCKQLKIWLRILHIFSQFNNPEVLNLLNFRRNPHWHEFCEVNPVRS
jgi:hypothetical protein